MISVKSLAEPQHLPKRSATMRPKFLVGLAAVLALLGVAGGYIEITQSRRDIMDLLQTEAETVTEALAVSAENAVQAYAEVEALLEAHLLDAANMLLHLERENKLTRNQFETLLRDSQVARACKVDQTGALQGFAYPESSREAFHPENLSPLVAPLFEEGQDETGGLVEDWEGRTHYAVAVRSGDRRAWVLCSDPQALLDFRKRVGLGRLIQNLGENKEVAYIVLQDEQGLISASKNVTTISSLQSDPFLQEALRSTGPRSRITSFAREDVFEVVKPFTVGDEPFGLIRVGLKMDVAKLAVKRTMQRAVVVAFGFVVLGLILFNFLVSNQNYELLTDAYAKIKTYTGNILENMADAVVAVDREGHITVFNRAAEQLFGRPSRDAVGKSCQEIIGTQSSALDETLATGREVQDREVTYTLDGRERILSVTTRLLRTPKGEIDSAVAVIKDLTEQKALQERLRRQEKLTAMGELASGVAHEIRNPLNAISIIAQRFAYEFTPTQNEKEYRELAQSVVTASRQVSAIIERFLEFARPPALNLHRHALNDVVHQAVALVESQARAKGLHLEFSDAEPLELALDSEQMQEVFVNLLQNAVQATPAGGRISVRLRREEEQAVVEIADTGTGIPPEHLSRIFDLYFTTKPDGTGMGLSVSHRIVIEHGGRIDVHSRVGEGSTFRVVLPLERNEGQSEEKDE